jgi:acetyl-CoA synthetase
MQDLNLKYVNETYDEKGCLKTFSLNIPDDFNFGYDIVDEMARREPDKTAMVWVGADGRDRKFTFGDMKKYSDKTANFLRGLGIGKGDMVMLILKRHYEFWFSIVALHKLGAVTIPATALLTEKDLVYRFNAANVKAVICTADGEVAEHVDRAAEKSPSLKYRIVAHGEREGWLSFTEGMEAAPEEFKRPTGKDATNVHDVMLSYFTSGTSGNAQARLPRLHLSARAYHHRQALAARQPRGTASYGRRDRLGQSRLGQAVWAMDNGGRRFRLRLR